MQFTITGMSHYTACETIGLSKCFAAMAKHGDYDVMEYGIGFNANSGYVFIALDSGITIASLLGNDVEYLITDYDTGEEFFYSYYDDAVTSLDNLQRAS
jgi:hypothetical protein|tara:strand:+ start:28 stop:324 length:297 start_codon:yes stop_codon:yes gene_type:complete